MGRYDLAIADQTVAIKVGSRLCDEFGEDCEPWDEDDARYHMERAKAYMATGQQKLANADYAEAIKYLTKAIKEYSKSASARSAHSERAKAYMATGQQKLANADYAEAIKYLTTSIKEEPRSASAYDTRGGIYEAIGRKDAAVADYRKALELDQSITESKKALKRLKTNPSKSATISRTKELKSAAVPTSPPPTPLPAPSDPKSSGTGATPIVGIAGRANDILIAKLDDAIAKHPKDPDNYFIRGTIFAGKGKLDRAIADYDKAILLNAKHALFYSHRGAAYRKKGEKERAESDLVLAIALDPENAAAYRQRVHGIEGSAPEPVSAPVQAGQKRFMAEAHLVCGSEDGARINIKTTSTVSSCEDVSIGTFSDSCKITQGMLEKDFLETISVKLGKCGLGKPEAEIASLPGTDTSGAVEPNTQTPNPRELALALQKELNRVGCNAGRADGSWGRKGRNALSRFNTHAKLDLPTDQPTAQAVEAVKDKTVRVCAAATKKPSSVQKKSAKVTPAKVIKKKSEAGYCNDACIAKRACSPGYKWRGSGDPCAWAKKKLKAGDPLCESNWCRTDLLNPGEKYRR